MMTAEEQAMHMASWHDEGFLVAFQYADGMMDSVMLDKYSEAERMADALFADRNVVGYWLIDCDEQFVVESIEQVLP